MPLFAASTAGKWREDPTDDYSRKPLYQPRSTESVAVKKVSKAQRQRMADTILDPDFSLTWAFLALGPLIAWYHPAAADGTPSLVGVFGAGFHILFAALLWVQTSRVRCVFEKDSFTFYNIRGPRLDLSKGATLVRKPDNYVAATENRWKYDSIINYGFFPSELFPVICYFKETETPSWKWNRWFAAFDSYGRGQPHFFPGICNVSQFKKQMEERGVKSKPIPTMKRRPIIAGATRSIGARKATNSRK